MPHPQEIEDQAERLYTVYCHAVGGKAYDGRPLPAWAEFSADPGKQTQANGWRALGELVANDPRVGKLQATIDLAGNSLGVATRRIAELEEELKLTKQRIGADTWDSQKQIVAMEAALKRIAGFPIHSEPVGAAYACQDIATEALKGGAR